MTYKVWPTTAVDFRRAATPKSPSLGVWSTFHQRKEKGPPAGRDDALRAAGPAVRGGEGPVAVEGRAAEGGQARRRREGEERPAPLSPSCFDTI